MKKLLSILCILLVFTVFKFQSVDAGIARFDLYGITLPRFAYVNYYDAGDIKVNTDIHFHIVDMNSEIIDIDLSGEETMYQVDYEGDIIQFLDKKIFTLSIDEFTAEVTMNFHDIRFNDNNLAFYIIKIDGVIYYSGVLSNDNPDLTNYYDMVVFTEDELSKPYSRYQIIHYRFPEDILDIGNYVNVRNFNIYTGLIEWSMTSTALVQAQIGDSTKRIETFTTGTPSTTDEVYTVDYHIQSVESVFVDGSEILPAYYTVGLDSVTVLNAYVSAGDEVVIDYYHENEQIKNGFIMIPLDGEIPPFLITDYLALNALYPDLETPYGSYLLSIASSAGVYLSYDTQVWNYTSEVGAIFELFINPSNVLETGTVYATFSQKDNILSTVYSTYYAQDDEYLELVYTDIPHNSITISYPVPSTLAVGDTGTVDWWIYPEDVDIIGAVPSDYMLKYYDSYYVVESADSLAGIDRIFSFLGVENDLIGIFVSVILLVAINVMMLFFKNGMLTLVANAMALIILIFLGYSPIWMTMGVGLILILGFLIVLRNGGGLNNE